ncbi:MAG: DNA polymerase [Patescibacteria group bacterium]
MGKKEGQKRLVLLDAHAIIHRAYHALPDFSSSKGEPTGGLYGLSAMLMKLIDELKPDYIAACFDLPGPTHRHDVYEGYKGTRTKIDENLVLQINRARDVFAAFSIPIYEAPGFEADDVLGTITEQFKQQKNLQIVIASGDMDTLQLIDGERVVVFTLRKGLSDTVTYDEKKVLERFGFGPEKIPDYKGLRGDPSDNIPGIKGIGEKAATELILAFGSVAQMYDAIKKNPDIFQKKGIKPRVATLVTGGEDDAVFSTMLATIRRDAPINFTLPKKEWREEVDLNVLLVLFDELEFRTLGARAKSLFHGGGEEVKEEVPTTPADPQKVQEATIALWLLYSDTTNPDEDDVLRVTRAATIDEAHTKLIAQLGETGRLREVFEYIELPLVPIIEKMHTDGVKLDTAYLKKLSDEYHKKLSTLEKKITAQVGKEFNINSPAQLAEVLFVDMKLSIPRHKKTASGRPSTREAELEKLKGAHPIIEDILAYRELQKLLSTYIDSLPTQVGDDGRLHARFLQAGTTTGRMASQNPNLQNIPIRSEYGSRIRSAFVAEKGWTLLAMDYSQIELRIAAGLSGDAKLVKIFQDGGDVHRAVAAEVFRVAPQDVDPEMRRRAKIINFGIIYGMGVNALRVNLGETVSREEASGFLTNYFDRFSGLAAFLEKTKQDAARKGYTETLFGRRRAFSGFQSSLPHIRAQAERMALNAPVQGTAADIIKKAMSASHAWLTAEKLIDGARLLMQVHDELVYEVREKDMVRVAEGVMSIMEAVVPPKDLSGVPIVVDGAQGGRWGDMEDIKR